MDVYEIRTMGDRLHGNPYPGRGIVTGTTPDGKRAAIAYFIMGRSQNSRNRVFVPRGDDLFTEPFDASRVEDPSLIIYAAVRTLPGGLIVTNGDQTDTIFDTVTSGGTFQQAGAKRCFEPDGPNWTPRISSMLTFGDKFTYEMSILKSIDPEGSDCARFTWSFPSKPGLGHFLHTYMTDGSPIPTFCGEPERVSIPDDMDALAEDIWKNLDENNKISLYVRYTDLATGRTSDRLVNKNV